MAKQSKGREGDDVASPFRISSTVNEDTLYNLCNYGLLYYDRDDEEYEYDDEYDVDDDDDDESYWHGKNPIGRNDSARGAAAVAATRARLNFTEYDSEDDELPLSPKAERNRRRRNRKQIRRIAQQRRTDSGVLLIDRFSETEFEALLQAFLLLKQPSKQDEEVDESESSITENEACCLDEFQYKELLATVRVRRNSREWTRTRSLQQIQQLFAIISTGIPGLSHLDVTGFDSTNDEIDAIATCLYGHPTLQKLDIDTLNFDPRVLQALETIPNLEYVGLDMRDSTPLAPLVSSPTSSLTASSHLKHLKLSSYNYFFYNNEDAALDMIESLKTNKTLETLDIKLICDSMVKAIVDMLRYNTKLQNLTFAALLDGDQQKANDFFLNLSTAMEVNTTLKSLVIGNEMDVASTGQDAILDMLCHRNHTLEELHFDWWRPATTHPRREREDFEASKNFFLLHNRLDTKRVILTNRFPTSHWIDLLSEHRDHVKSLYYFLCMNPSAFVGQHRLGLAATPASNDDDDT